MQIGVVAKFRVKKEYLEEVYNEIVTLHKLTHELDSGCIQYDLTQDIDDEQTFIFVETWENSECLVEHSQKEHFKNFMESIENKVEDVQINKTIKKL